MTIEELRDTCLSPRAAHLPSRIRLHTKFAFHPEAKEDDLHLLYKKAKVKEIQEIAADAICSRQDISISKILHIALRPHSKKIAQRAFEVIRDHEECSIEHIKILSRHSRLKVIKSQAQKILLTTYKVSDNEKRYFSKYGADEEIRTFAMQSITPQIK